MGGGRDESRPYTGFRTGTVDHGPGNELTLRDEALGRVPRIVHGFTTRRGGVSTGPYESLNLSTATGDARKNVSENQRRVMTELGLGERVVVRAGQPHGSRVAIIDDRLQLGSREGTQVLDGVDALITDREDVALLLTFADCVPIFLAAADGSCGGVAHAGWRGIVQNVAGTTVGALREALGVEAHQVRVWIGPAVEGACYEVGEEVLRALRRAAPGPQTFWSAGSPGKAFVDLRSAVWAQLANAGVMPEAISVDEHCTACDDGLFFSHRRQGKPHGAMAAVIGLRGA